MNEIFSRTERIVGSEGIEKLQKSHVLIFGIGGVGGHCIEALVRAGIGKVTIVDKDTVDITNINRQIIADLNTVGMKKTEAMEARLKNINRDVEVICKDMFYLPEEGDNFDFSEYSYVVDAIDNVTAKLDIIARSKGAGTPVISSMGTGNKLEPTMLEVSDIHKTSVCPLAKVIRKELKKRNIKDVKVVYSKEEPLVRANPPGSVSFVPSAAGLIIAGEVVKDILNG
ncbi:MAG: tRNA threonylcarbamoyladenosine dehydratase [Eubacterium sp.]|nr:tRNA threonylcarbamoyladenosine dehydratase [Eubacterium sp.]